MKDEELESTKPIKKLDDEVVSREEKYENVVEEFLETREERYEKKLEEEKAREAEEEAEKALAQKNILLAEELEEAEKEVAAKAEEEEEVEEEKKPKEKPMVRFKKWWASLDKSQKVIYAAIAILFFLLFVLLVVGVIALVSKDDKKPEETKQEEQMVIDDQAPVMFDNYYYKGGTLYFLGEGGKEIGSYDCDNKSEKECSVAVNNYRDVLDVAMVASEDGEYMTEYVAIVDDNFVFINDTASGSAQSIILYSIKNQERIATYGDVKAYDGGYYAVSDSNGKYGLIQITNEAKTIIKHQYEYLGMIDNENYLIAKEKKGYILIDKKDRGISNYITANEVKYYNSNFIVTKDNGMYSVYNLKGQQIETGYTFATVKNKYMFLVNDRMLYVKDASGNKYNEDGVPLVNSDYVKTYILDQDGGLVKTKRSFETEVKGNDINIAVYNATYDDPQYKTLNILEANLNKNYDYVSYLDGKLYFYKDDKKTELIGSYTCTNKNEITAKSTSYSQCFIAKDTIYEDNDLTTTDVKNRKSMIPLINEKYVFVKDDNIVLYDAESQTILSTYTSVNTYSDNNDNKFVKRKGTVEVVAVNRKGKYGVIKIDSSGVKATQRFNYNKIERLGDYLIGQDTNNKWLVFVDNKIDGFLSGKIQGYTSDMKHYKIKINGFYEVYNEEGEKIGSEANYIELYSGFYASVNSSNELTIHDYTGKKISAEAVTIGNYPMSRTKTPAFKVKKADNEFVVSVYNGKSYDDKHVGIITEENHEQG